MLCNYGIAACCFGSCIIYCPAHAAGLIIMIEKKSVLCYNDLGVIEGELERSDIR